ncbi:MAG: sugar phosphate isomerase/epimerase [Defluviitaleaceae bacterium]|nr:sugar phosphate isomerase/epimerase [Defluviitaleaceae bacterium]MCL2240462.1 sugar phosphate isomerase/epimerase [Defluviitaleaceae bacterium]
MRKYAVQLYSVRDELARDLWGTLRKVRAMGYEGVEFFWEFTHTAQELKAALEDTGLVCCGWHTPWHNVQPGTLMATITYNKVLGNNEIVIPGLPGEMTHSKQAWLDTAKQFNEVATQLAPYGMKLAYHNHHQEFQALEGDLPIHYFMEGTAPEIGFQLDNGNAFHAGADTDVYAPLTRYPGRVRTIHLKPYSIKNGYATMIGEDDIDWPRFFALCEKHQPIDWYIVEYECTDKYPQLDGIRLCIDALRRL